MALEIHTGVFTDHSMLAVLTGFGQAALAAGVISDGQAATWIAEQTRRAQADRMFLAMPLFVASARRL